ncbi:50S ribosomal protein L15 [Planctomycetales bacterium ZRK34]|nr:50S ribosomal protein L15 [Planctomycetales bacterium ZRK34]
MMIHEITPLVGKHKRRKRIGRGPGSGHGKTAGRGHKGAGSRSGFTGSIRATREGGQMPYFRRIPKRGFNNAVFTKRYAAINVSLLETRFEDGETVSPETLKAHGLVPNVKTPIKILANGELSKKLSVTAHQFSEAARAKIESAGGSCTLIGGAKKAQPEAAKPAEKPKQEKADDSGE